MARAYFADERTEGLPDVRKFSRAERIDFQADLLIAEPQFHHLGERVMTLLANGVSPPKIETLVGVDSDVVRRIRDRNPKFLRNIKEQIANNLAEASQILSERLLDTAPTMPLKHLAQTLSASIDKMQLLSGGVTARSEVRQITSPEELQKIFDSLPNVSSPSLLPDN
jgi:hypothetical protein